MLCIDKHYFDMHSLMMIIYLFYLYVYVLTFFSVVIMAAHVTPLDVISHLPIACEEKDVPYAFVSTKEALGAAGGTKRPTSVVMVCESSSSTFAEAYAKAKTGIDKIQGEASDEKTQE